jgi:hypothetical protein
MKRLEIPQVPTRRTSATAQAYHAGAILFSVDLHPYAAPLQGAIMNLWTRLTARFGPQSDMLGFAPTATPTADVWLYAFTDNFMSRSTAANGADALMSGLRFYTPTFVA